MLSSIEFFIKVFFNPAGTYVWTKGWTDVKSFFVRCIRTYVLKKQVTLIEKIEIERPIDTKISKFYLIVVFRRLIFSFSVDPENTKEILQFKTKPSRKATVK